MRAAREVEQAERAAELAGLHEKEAKLVEALEAVQRVEAQAEALQSVVARLTVSGKARQPARRGGTAFALAAVGDYTPLSARGFSAKA